MIFLRVLCVAVGAVFAPMSAWAAVDLFKAGQIGPGAVACLFVLVAAGMVLGWSNGSGPARIHTGKPWVGYEGQCPVCGCGCHRPRWDSNSQTIRAKCWRCGVRFSTGPKQP